MYKLVHPVEHTTLKHQPHLATTPVSKCLPGWTKLLCEAFEKGEGITLNHYQVGAIAHTLIAARKREFLLSGGVWPEVLEEPDNSEIRSS